MTVTIDLHTKTLVCALPGGGKTYLGGTLPKPLFLLTEWDISIATLLKVERYLKIDLQLDKSARHVETRAQYEQAITELQQGCQKGTIPYDSVSLDSFSDLQQGAFISDIQQSAPKFSKGRDMRNTDILEPGEWNWLQNISRRALIELRDLPLHVYVTTQVITIKGEQWNVPFIQPKGFGLLAAQYFNLAGYLKAQTVKDEQGVKHIVRVLTIEQTDEVPIAKNINELVLPGVLYNPNMTDIINALNGKEETS